jgi:hypothetical protein
MKLKALASERCPSSNQYSATFGERQRKKGCDMAAIVWPEFISFLF